MISGAGGDSGPRKVNPRSVAIVTPLCYRNAAAVVRPLRSHEVHVTELGLRRAGRGQDVVEKRLDVEAGDEEPGLLTGVDGVRDEALDDALLLHVHHLGPGVQEASLWVACHVLLHQRVRLLDGLRAYVGPPNAKTQRAIASGNPITLAALKEPRSEVCFFN